MINWIKYIFGSFFSNKLTKEGHHRSFWNCVLQLFLAFMILTAFFSTGYIASYSTHYKNATDFKDFSYYLFANSDVSSRVNLKVSYDGDGNAFINTIDPETCEDKELIINTFDSQADRLVYSKNGYNVIVDTRDSTTTYTKFTAEYYDPDGNALTPDEYRNYSSQSSCTGNINYSLEDADLSDETIASYANWLATNYAEGDDVYTSYSELDALDHTSKDYINGIYELYVKTYYSFTTVPTNQIYYQQTYAVLDDNNQFVYTNYILLTDSWALISFTNDKGINLTYDGYYNSLSDGYSIRTYTTSTTDLTAIDYNVDTLYLGIFNSVASIKTLYTGMSVLRFFIYVIIGLLVMALFIYCMAKLKKREYGSSFLGDFKMACSFTIFSACIAGIAEFILSFFVDVDTAFGVGLWGFLSCICIRTFILGFVEEIRYRRNPNYDVTPTIPTTTLSHTSDELDNFDLSHVDSGTKVIKNEKADDDDDEKMELM